MQYTKSNTSKTCAIIIYICPLAKNKVLSTTKHMYRHVQRALMKQSNGNLYLLETHTDTGVHDCELC